MKNKMLKFGKTIFIGVICAFMLIPASFAYKAEAVKNYNKGIELTGKEIYKKAVSCFEKAIKADPTFIDAYYNLGILQEFLGEKQKAVETFEKVLKFAPDDFDTIYKLATLHYTMDNLEKADEFIKQIPPEDPNYNRLVAFMSDPTRNVYDVNRQEATEDDSLERLNGPDSCETIKESISTFHAPTGIVKDTNNNIYIADFNNNSIVFISNTGDEKVIAKNGLLKGPVGLAMDKYNNLYVANYDSSEIVLLPASGEDPHVLPIKVDKPYFLMVDNSGVLYVSEQGSNSVSKHKLIWKN